MSNDYVKVQRRPPMELLTCPLCSNLYREATTVCVCLHSFCRQCKYQKLEEDNRNHCPVCNAYLGSFPEELLRNDHNSRELVMQIFPLGKTSGEESSEASSVKIKNAETAAPTLTEANIQRQDFSMPREAKRIHDDRDVTRYNLHLNETPNGRSNHSVNAIKKQGHAQVKRRRRTKRKPCKFLTGQREDGSMIWTEKEMPKPGASDLGKSINSGKQFGGTLSLKELPGYSSRPVWFCLLACQEKKGMALPQIPKPFISTRDGDLAVSFVNKYLARKLNLKHESEVEVMCLGHSLVPTLTLNNLIDIWVDAVSNMGPMSVNCNADNGNGGNFVMELTYRRTKKQRALQSNLDLMEP
ncbi:PREDICTED: E3 ubiquitin protein ligase DRIP2 isoform X4 [Theobroma cacao]|uniref:E3 ubiquitin protein ligase DRIP2 isoform X4 n=1 Tax=Theobroma cacao TaxID=3641 RepID=A0AB32WUA0_THECC|nr:PREDICTED: E3 ubiquitin protein ligase DRIP2 isoform X4 [Theobroma cacao]